VSSIAVNLNKDVKTLHHCEDIFDKPFEELKYDIV
jgi:hypothetical protein